MRSVPPRQINVAEELKDMGKQGVKTNLSQSKELRAQVVNPGGQQELIRRTSAPAKLVDPRKLTSQQKKK